MMNLGTKRDLDALLKDWPARPSTWNDAPDGSEQDDERKWDERADGIVKAALERKGASDAGLDTLLAPPDLAPEPGESGVVLFSGKKTMTEEKAADIASPDTGTPLPEMAPAPVVATTPPAERKRTSLKEITARASQSGGARPSSSGTPPPPSVAPARLASSPPSARSSVTPLPRPTEAGKEDSGVINLNVVRAAATPLQIAAAEAAVPGQQGLFDDDKTVESAASPVQQAAAAKPPTQISVVAAKKSSAGPMAGVAIAVLGIAAAFAIIMKKPPAQTPTAEVAPTVAVAPPKVAATPTPVPQPTAEATAVASADATAAPTADPKAAEPGRLAVAPVISGGAAVKDPAKSSAPAPATTGAPVAPVAPVAGGAPGDLASEMARAAGGTKAGDKDAVVAVPEPAAARNQNIPEKPSQGSVQAAVGAVAGSAKSCVAGADEISHATVTFSGAGNVSSVSVSGWAAAHGKSACVQAAMKAAKVGPFSSSSFTVSVPIRP